MKHSQILLIVACAASLQCSPHAGTSKITQQVSFGYGSRTTDTKIDPRKFGAGPAIGAYLIGYL